MTDWTCYDIPQYVCDLQAAWDRRHRVRMAKLCSGVSFRELAKALGIGTQRVRQLCAKAEWEIEAKQKSPVEFFLSRPDSQLRRLPNKPKVTKAISRLTSGRDWLNI
jgi:hypothetical protein